MKVLLNVSPEALPPLLASWHPVAGIRLLEEPDGSFSLAVAPDEESLNRAIRDEEDLAAERSAGPSVQMPPGVDR